MTLSAGVLALVLTLLKDIMKTFPVTQQWILFLLALLDGVSGILAITGTLGKTKELSTELIYSLNIKIPAFSQVFFFGIGMIFTVIFGLGLIFNFLFCTI